MQSWRTVQVPVDYPIRKSSPFVTLASGTGKKMFLFDTVWQKCGGLRIKIPEPIVIKEFTPKKMLEKGLRRYWAAAKPTCCICTSYKHFLPVPSSVHRVDANAPVFREGTLFFTVHLCTFSLEQGLRPTGSCYTSGLYLRTQMGRNQGQCVGGSANPQYCTLYNVLEISIFSTHSR